MSTIASSVSTPVAVHPVAGRLVARSELGPQQRRAMHALLDAHFEGSDYDRFCRDLEEKNWVILLEQGNELVGFSSLLVYETAHAGEPLSVVYSGDTIVRRDAWGSSALARTWIASVNQLRQLYPRGRYYWLLITSGFRTYHFLPLFWREFYPRHDAATPADVKDLIDHLAA